MTERETFLLVDDNTLLRGSLAKLIGMWRKDALIVEAANVQEALEQARRLKPQVILMDIRMPEGSGLEATRLIKSELPETKIIMLTVSDDEEDLFEAMSSGAHGYLLKDMNPEELLERLEDALRGEAVIAAPMAQHLLNALVEQGQRRGKEGQSEAELSPREREVLDLVRQGATNKEIAEKLFISVGTVKNHIHNILEKLNLTNRTQIAAYARMRKVTRSF
ncbi:MAG TPA: response regulator transcription factor [Dehalococcoidia bacterium]